MKKILCICLSSTLQKTISFDSVKITEVNRSKKYRLDASGKAVNSARILEQLEKNCERTFCPLGTENYRLFLKLAAQDGINIVYEKIPGFTRECCTLLDKSSASTTELVVGEPVLERTEKFKKLEKKLLYKTLRKEIDRADAVLLAGSRPAIWRDSFYQEICEYAVKNGKICLADFCGEDLRNTLKTCIPQIIKINDDEFLKTFANDNEENLKEMIIQKSREFNNIIIVTRGKDSTYAAKSGIFSECPSEELVPVNTTACGDSFNAGFLHEYLATGDLEKALKKGTWCAARNAESEIPGDISTAR